MYEPIRQMSTLRTNGTLHGRSVHRPENVSGHNVFKGYNSPGTGDAVDLFASGGVPVYAIGYGVQTRWRNDATRLEVIYIEGNSNGVDWLAVYAHINAKLEAEGVHVQAGDVVGSLRSDLSDPHLHFELWLDGKAVAAENGNALRDKMLALFADHAPAWEAGDAVKIIGSDGKVLTSEAEFDGQCVMAPVRPLLEGLGYKVVAHPEQHKVYVQGGA